jgi:hypothetical protein
MAKADTINFLRRWNKRIIYFYLFGVAIGTIFGIGEVFHISYLTNFMGAFVWIFLLLSIPIAIINIVLMVFYTVKFRDKRMIWCFILLFMFFVHPLFAYATPILFTYFVESYYKQLEPKL